MVNLLKTGQIEARLSPLEVPHSVIEGVLWPAVPGDVAARLLALQHQLEESQWWPPDVMLCQQFRQLGRLLDHAFGNIVFYRERLAAAGYRPGQEITPELWRRLPILTRREVREAGEAIVTANVPRGHGRLLADATGGSTGIPLKILKTELWQFFWAAFTLREELWHRRDWRLKLAAIRYLARGSAPYPEGSHHEDWGPPVATVYPTGPLAMLNVATRPREQAEWLLRENPDYLLVNPSSLMLLARYFRENGLALPRLLALRTLGEAVGPDLRRACRAAWGVEIADMYSAAEAGYLAVQCPQQESYHIQSESALVEVLDEAGNPCRPGETGTVVVTPLHNFAMPLIRYAIGDIAEVGAPCACGRGLPVLGRILGRVRQMLVLPSGARRYGNVGDLGFAEIKGVVQYQVAQTSLRNLEVRLVVRPPFAPGDEDKVRQKLRDNFGEYFSVSFSYHAEIPRAPSGKYFEFVSEIAE